MVKSWNCTEVRARTHSRLARRCACEILPCRACKCVCLCVDMYALVPACLHVIALPPSPPPPHAPCATPARAPGPTASPLPTVARRWAPCRRPRHTRLACPRGAPSAACSPAPSSRWASSCAATSPPPSWCSWQTRRAGTSSAGAPRQGGRCWGLAAAGVVPLRSPPSSVAPRGSGGACMPLPSSPHPVTRPTMPPCQYSGAFGGHTTPNCMHAVSASPKQMHEGSHAIAPPLRRPPTCSVLAPDTEPCRCDACIRYCACTHAVTVTLHAREGQGESGRVGERPDSW